jgi:hypothetical protein
MNCDMCLTESFHGAPTRGLRGSRLAISCRQVRLKVEWRHGKRKHL